MKYVDVGGSGRLAIILNYLLIVAWICYVLVLAGFLYGILAENEGVLDLVFASFGGVDLVLSILIVVAFFVFLVWYAKAYKNLKAFGQEPKTSVGWAVADFFIPIINFFEPYRRVKEIWKGSGAEEESRFVLLWWLFFLFGGIVLYAGEKMMERLAEGDYYYALIVTIVGVLVQIFAATLTIKLLKKVTALQVEKGKSA